MNNDNRINVGVIQLAFNKKTHAVNVRPWVTSMGLDKVKDEDRVVGYSMLAFYKDQPECIVSSWLFDTPEEAWSNTDEVKAYETYDDAIEALADVIGAKA